MNKELKAKRNNGENSRKKKLVNVRSTEVRFVSHGKVQLLHSFE